MSSTLRITLDVALPPATAFDLVCDELAAAFAPHGFELTSGADGRVTDGDTIVGEIETWEPGRRAVFRWHQAGWDPAGTTTLELIVEPREGGAQIRLEQRGLGDVLGTAGEVIGWVASEVIAPAMRGASPRAFGDWYTDRYARRPSGPQARATYADPLYHYPNFRVILSELALRADDYFLEVGCGGGALLKDVLTSGCRATAIDHSFDMVRLARHTNATGITDGRLQIVEASAEALPFGDGTFTCAAMTGVLGFLPDPVAAFSDIRRVLRPGGRFVALGSDPELRGTPGAPEPMASRLRFYDDRALAELARGAGFADVRLIRRDLGAYAREAGIPEAHLPLFESPPGEGARFLVCRT